MLRSSTKMFTSYYRTNAELSGSNHDADELENDTTKCARRGSSPLERLVYARHGRELMG